MVKYTDKQKLEAVNAYRKGTGCLGATAKAQGVHVDSLRKWVNTPKMRETTGSRDFVVDLLAIGD